MVKNIRAFLIFAVALGSSTGFSAFLAVELEPRFVYQDLDRFCTIEGSWKTTALSGTVDQDKLVKASFNRTKQIFELLPEELEGIVMKRDALGELYVVTLPLSVRALNWLFFHMDGWDNACSPSQWLRTLSPYGHTYQFRQSSSSDYITALQRFSGTRYDGTPYSLKLGFAQRHP